MSSAPIAAVVRQMRHEAVDVISLRLEAVDGGQLPEWTAGAHIDLVLPTGTVRQYSLCGDPNDRTSYTVAIHREAGSRGGSEYVHMFLRPGQRVRISEPRNHFALIPANEYIFIAGGIGVTPILALAKSVAGRAPFSVLYLGRGAESMAFAGELTELGPTVTVHDSAVDGRFDLGAALANIGEHSAVYACGSESLITMLEEFAEAWPTGVFHTERFKPRVRPPSIPTPFEIVWQPSGAVLSVPASRSALTVLEDAGLPVTGSCREGVCGTCEVTLLSGEAEHRDDVVDDHATAYGERFFPCVSRAVGPSVTLRLS